MKYYNLIKEKRDNSGFTTRELGKKVGVSGSYISMIENNKLTNPPSDEVLEKICKELNFTEKEKEIFYDLLDEKFLPKRINEKIQVLKNSAIIQNNNNNGDILVGSTKNIYNSLDEDLIGLNEDEIQLVKNYIAFLKSQKLAKK